jgi:hypothetical protein
MQAARRRGIRLPQPEDAVETRSNSRLDSPDILLGSDINGHGSQVDDEERVSYFPCQTWKSLDGGEGVGCVAMSNSFGTFRDTL